MRSPKDEKDDVDLPLSGPGSELRGEPFVGDARPSAWAPPADMPAKPGTGEAEVVELPLDDEKGDADVQEQPPRPPGKEDQGIRGRPGQQAGE